MADSVYFCPKCGSANLEVSLLIGSQAKCKSCGWEGGNSELLTAAIQPTVGGLGRQAEKFALDLRNLMAKPPLGTMVLQLLVQHKFIPANDPSAISLFARYLRACASGMARAVVEETEAIEKERTSATRPT